MEHVTRVVGRTIMDFGRPGSSRLLLWISGYIAFLVLHGCSILSDTEDPFVVEYKGALKSFMLRGDLSAKEDLTNLQDIEHLYALGALENLKGEILILDGRPFISSVQNGELIIEHTFERKAALLVYASVPQWRSDLLPDSVRTYRELETYLTQEAGKQGIDTERPFPFLISGMAETFDWHVINWPEGDSEHSHKKHRTSGPNGTKEGETVEILGFYSNRHHGVFTHHSTHMHLHVRLADGTLSGHLDDLTLGSGMTLKLPLVK